MFMSPVSLLQKLIEIERAIGVLDPHSLRKLVIDAQGELLMFQKDAADRVWADATSMRCMYRA